MIQVSRLNGTDLWLNPMLIESIERTPDTIVTLTNGHKYVIHEPPEAINQQIQQFYTQIGLVGSAARKDAAGK